MHSPVQHRVPHGGGGRTQIHTHAHTLKVLPWQLPALHHLVPLKPPTQDQDRTLRQEADLQLAQGYRANTQWTYTPQCPGRKQEPSKAPAVPQVPGLPTAAPLKGSCTYLGGGVGWEERYEQRRASDCPCLQALAGAFTACHSGTGRDGAGERGWKGKETLWLIFCRGQLGQERHRGKRASPALLLCVAGRGLAWLVIMYFLCHRDPPSSQDVGRLGCMNDRHCLRGDLSIWECGSSGTLTSHSSGPLLQPTEVEPPQLRGSAQELPGDHSAWQ